MPQTTASTAPVNQAHPNRRRSLDKDTKAEDKNLAYWSERYELEAHYGGTLGLTRSCDVRYGGGR